MTIAAATSAPQKAPVTIGAMRWSIHVAYRSDSLRAKFSVFFSDRFQARVAGEHGDRARRGDPCNLHEEHHACVDSPAIAHDFLGVVHGHPAHETCLEDAEH